MKKILLFDNYDSFTYNLYHLVRELGYTDVEVHRNDCISLDEVERFDKIILSPGPGIPSEAGLLLPLIKRFAAHKSILGVCLGHQAIGEAFGASLINLPSVFHGISSHIQVVENDVLFEGLPTQLEVGRYHSWIVNPHTLPSCFHISAFDEEGHIMSFYHTTLPIHAVQYHPESIITRQGRQMINNWINK